MSIFIAVIMFAGGFAACWFTKDAIVKAVTGTEAFINALEARAAALKAVL
jgi:hypothetical protein